MARRGLDRAQVVAAAAALADEEGLDAVTLARVAAGFGVRPPSLYNHVESRDALLRAVAAGALRDLAADMREAATGRAGGEALRAVAEAYRAFAHGHPGRYAVAMATLPGADDEPDAAAREVLDVLQAVLRAWDLDEAAAVHAIRAFRSAVHGFVAIEAAGGFAMPVALDESFARLIGLLAAGLG